MIFEKFFSFSLYLPWTLHQPLQKFRLPTIVDFFFTFDLYPFDYYFFLIIYKITNIFFNLTPIFFKTINNLSNYKCFFLISTLYDFFFFKFGHCSFYCYFLFEIIFIFFYQISSFLIFFLSNFIIFFLLLFVFVFTSVFINIFPMISSFKIKLIEIYVFWLNLSSRFHGLWVLKIKSCLIVLYELTWFFFLFEVDVFFNV